jgi:hypothetical protein
MMAGSSTGVEYQYCGPEVSEAAVFLTAAVVIFLLTEAVMTGVLTVMQETGALGPAALDWFFLAAPAWSGCLKVLSFPYQHLHSIKSDLFLLFLVKHMLEGLDDGFIVVGVVGISGDCGV